MSFLFTKYGEYIDSYGFYHKNDVFLKRLGSFFVKYRRSICLIFLANFSWCFLSFIVVFRTPVLNNCSERRRK